MTTFFKTRRTWLALLVIGVILSTVSILLFFTTPLVNTINFESISFGVQAEIILYTLILGLPVGFFTVLLVMGLIRLSIKRESTLHRSRTRVWQVFLLLWIVFFGLYISYFLYEIPSAITKETIMIEMSDGTKLNTVLYRRNPSATLPVVLMRTPYGSMTADSGADKFVDLGFHVVVQDCRGTPPSVPGLFSGHLSEGDFFPFLDDITDGNETINWIAQQPWCNGKVVMYGVSYLGWTQFASAFYQPEALIAITPTIFGSTPYSAVYSNGVFQLNLAGIWYLLMSECANGFTTSGEIEPPLSTLDQRLCNTSKNWTDLLDHPARDSFWEIEGISQCLEQITVPMYHEIGYFDYFAEAGIKDFNLLCTRTDFAANHSILVLSPHGHGPVPLELRNTASHITDVNVDQEQLAFLVGAVQGTFPDRLVKAYIIGADKWMTDTTWPFANTTMTQYFLRENFKLDLNAPTTNETADSYIYDPHDTLNYLNNPINNITWGDWADHTVVAVQDDSLVYELEIPSNGTGMTLCGQIEIHLNASTNCTDTDWIIEVLDHDPVSNRSMFLCHGMMRAAFNGSTMALVTPDEVKEYVFETWPIGAWFAPSHTLQFVIRSSKYPYYAKNSNNGNAYFDTEWVAAENFIYHSNVSASYIRLPVIP